MGLFLSFDPESLLRMVSKDILHSEHIMSDMSQETRFKTCELRDEIAFGTLRIYKNETIILRAMLCLFQIPEIRLQLPKRGQNINSQNPPGSPPLSFAFPTRF